jgi:hypothetical protein
MAAADPARNVSVIPVVAVRALPFVVGVCAGLGQEPVGITGRVLADVFGRRLP